MTKLSKNTETPNLLKPLLAVCAYTSDVYLMDCMELMAQYPDNYFDLAVVDPPYGIGVNKWLLGDNKPHKRKHTKGKVWDCETPSKEYFTELFRVSKNQIVWGANYFTDKLPISMGWIYWDKMRNEGLSFADGELAWTSFNSSLKSARIQYDGFLGMDKKRIHPTQKPIKLYDWLYSKYTTEGMKILDTHLGSGSSRISANKAKLNFVGCEIDKEYFDKSCKRYDDFVSQVRLF